MLNWRRLANNKTMYLHWEAIKGNSLKSDGSQTKIQKARCKWKKY